MKLLYFQQNFFLNFIRVPPRGSTFLTIHYFTLFPTVNQPQVFESLKLNVLGTILSLCARFSAVDEALLKQVLPTKQKLV